MPKVSVLMNCFNGEDYLEEAINSIYQQSFEDFEIVFIDNHSIDSSIKIAKSYDHRLKYFKTAEHVTLGAARNFGLRHCRGDYVAFLDTDDVWLPGKLKKQIQQMEMDASDLCFGSWVSIDKSGKKIKKHIVCPNETDYFSYLLKSFVINFQTVMLRNNNNLAFDESYQYAPDFDLFMQIAIHNKVSVISDPLVKYRIHNDSLSSRTMEYWGVEILKTLETIKRRHPHIGQMYDQQFSIAEAKGRYLKARYLIETKRDEESGIAEMGLITSQELKYKFLFLLARFPQIWRLLHKALKR